MIKTLTISHRVDHIKFNNHLNLINIFTLRGVSIKKAFIVYSSPPACHSSCRQLSYGLWRGRTRRLTACLFACDVCPVCPVCRAVNVISMIKTSTQIKRKRSRLTGPLPRPFLLTPPTARLFLFQPDPLCSSIIHRRTCSQLFCSASALTTLLFF